MTANGTVYALGLDNVRALGHRPGGHLRSPRGVLDYAVTPDGRVYWLQEDHHLRRSPKGKPGDYWGSFSDLRSFTVTANGTVVVLGLDNVLWRLGHRPEGTFVRRRAGCWTTR